MALIDDVKVSLSIISSDEFTDKRIELIIAAAKQHLRRYAPDLDEYDFENDQHNAKFLLLAYCRYAYSNAAEMFDANYKADIIALRQDYEVRQYENQKHG